jgi:hypothetical protein
MKRPCRSCQNAYQAVKEIDSFSTPIEVTFNGQTKVPSFVGCSMTLVLLTVMLLFIQEKLTKFVNKTNPNIQIAIFEDYFNPLDTIALHNFKFAFMVESFEHGKHLHDPKYVDWTVSLVTQVHNKVVQSQELKIQPCTDKDWAQFYKPKPEMKEMINDYKRKGQMLCLENDQEVSIYGKFRNARRYLDISFEAACSNQIKHDPKCVSPSFEDFKSYLNSP